MIRKTLTKLQDVNFGIRKGTLKRETKEVDIKGEFCIDGTGVYNINTDNDFLNHLFTVFAFHGLFDFTLNAKGDLKHHLFEDLGIELGKAFKKAIGDCGGIRRFGYSYVVMETALARVAIDVSGRSFYKRDVFYDRGMPDLDFDKTDGVTLEDIDKFMKGFSEHAKLNIHLTYTYYPEEDGRGDAHHVLEAIFKALGIALDQATQIDPRRKGVPSTKGVID